MVITWIVIGIAGLILLSMILCQPMIRPQRTPEHVTPADHGLDFEHAAFDTRDGIRIKGWWIPADGSERTIAFLHGYHGSKSPDLQYANLLHENGFNLLLFDMRAHGQSGGNITSIGALERLDALAAIDYVIEKGSKKIGLLGFSMGGRVAVLAGCESTSVDAIVCDCGPARIRTSMELSAIRRGVPVWLAKALAVYLLIGASLRCRVNLFRYEPIVQASGLEGIPALFIQGKNDPNIRLSETIEMVRKAGKSAALWLVEDAGHRDVSDLHQQEYHARLIEFFNASLSQKSSLNYEV